MFADQWTSGSPWNFLDYDHPLIDDPSLYNGKTPQSWDGKGTTYTNNHLLKHQWFFNGMRKSGVHAGLFNHESPFFEQDKGRVDNPFNMSSKDYRDEKPSLKRPIYTPSAYTSPTPVDRLRIMQKTYEDLTRENDAARDEFWDLRAKINASQNETECNVLESALKRARNRMESTGESARFACDRMITLESTVRDIEMNGDINAPPMERLAYMKNRYVNFMRENEDANNKIQIIRERRKACQSNMDPEYAPLLHDLLDAHRDAERSKKDLQETEVRMRQLEAQITQGSL